VRADNDVVKGIRKTSDALKSGRIKICKPCRDAIREFSLYRWDESAKYDAPRKENDHAMDDIRYFVMSLENSADGFFAVSVRISTLFVQNRRISVKISLKTVSFTTGTGAGQVV